MNKVYTGIESLSQVMGKYQVRDDTQSTRPINLPYEEAKRFGLLVGLSTPFVLKLFREFGKQNVLRLESYLRDYPNPTRKSLAGIIVWKLRGGDTNGSK